MDVLVRLALKGGHHWEFVCDEDDPMVFGLVSALPGATLDTSLPTDGLVQVEARGGQRFFLSRSSLVALTITRLAERQHTLAATALEGGHETALLAPTPFVMRENVFDSATTEALLQAAAANQTAAGIDGLQRVDIATLPSLAVEALIKILSDARVRLTSVSSDETHISVGVQQLLHSGLTRLALPNGSRRLLDFVLWLAAEGRVPGSIEACLPDRWLNSNANAKPTVRKLPIAPNTAVVFPAANAANALELLVAAERGPALILSGSLCEGVGVASH